MTKTKIALVGIGKIARDQHVPTLTESPDFELAAAVTRHIPPEGVPGFRTISDMKAALPDVAAVSICTPPLGRLQAVREALQCGLDIMIEKPPAASLSEARRIVEEAQAAGRVLFVSWHSREAPAVEPAKRWLEKKQVRRIAVNWMEDVRVWHPGQAWIWSPGIGVFDPGVNAFSILTELAPGPCLVKTAELHFPANKDAPIAARIEAAVDDASIEIVFDFDSKGPPLWDMEFETDEGRLSLSRGGAELAVDGARVNIEEEPEYRRLYRRFAGLLSSRSSDADLSPFELVADCFLLGRRATAPSFEDF